MFFYFLFYNFVFWRMFIFGTDKKGKGNNWVRTFHYGGGGLIILWGVWGDYGMDGVRVACFGFLLGGWPLFFLFFLECLCVLLCKNFPLRS